ncbi:MAG: hypothetical protein ACKOBG_09420 [Actinomycetota bacterium]
MPELPLPNFLVIGAQKSATRWLRLNLGLHPEIFTAEREIEFFNNAERFAGLGPAWYREQFAGWSGERLVGEATPGYMFWRHDPAVMAERIDATLPGVRPMAILRNPIDRSQSAVVHHIEAGGIPAGTGVLEYVRSVDPERDPLGIVSGSWYARSLEPFRDRFGDRLLVLLHDDADEDPRGVYTAALRHLGAATDFVPSELERVRYSYQQRDPSAHAEQHLSVAERRELGACFTDDIARLEQMLGRDLSCWAPDAPAV